MIVWERFLRLLGKPVVYHNKRTFGSSKRELVSFVNRNQDNPDGSYIGKHWIVGDCRILEFKNPRTISVFKGSHWSTDDSSCLWLCWVAPRSSWYSELGLMEFMLRGICNDSDVKAFVVRDRED